jgi:sentrin-specific protease 1
MDDQEKAGPSARDDDLHLLQSNCWLNDRIINRYMELLCKKFKNTYSFSTFTYLLLRRRPLSTVVEWYGKDTIGKYRYVCIPIHLVNHWTLAVMHDTNIEYYDSLNGFDVDVIERLKVFLRALGICKKLDGKNMSSSNIPLQTNGYDCGVFCCMYARFLVDDTIAGWFHARDVPRLRQMMFDELSNSELREVRQYIKLDSLHI